ncbi:MAG: bifunctional diaminohydroxyphosphoribosylaminopyrimidine deaminase/5-amino-6-(5-phosphoribosylamino)uracil reductase RibD [Eubacterium sp.]|nr:bifunctional diaminohydroxyphosphoribosylaminopyrimidine deaminase/5-amino-6-(5-phosphoribosylamino)uracil reductase RibD [Eubacterium sp.]
MNDMEYMSLALRLAEKGCGWTSPNPMVGAVIVKDGQIIGQGWHERYGAPHAERNALAACTQPPQGATMYVTLEPCCHHGKQPPCVEAVLEAGISRVVVGSADPNPLVGGKGIQILREHGVQVTEDVLREQCDRLNEVFLHYIQTRRPFVVLKYAMTMDGKIASYTGASKWITAEAARNHVQQQRHRYTAIMAGVGTVLADDPLLTCRIPDGKNPVRIICDTRLQTPLTSQIVATAKQVPTIFAACAGQEAYQEKKLALQEAGCRIIEVEEKNGHVDLQQLMKRLGEEQIDSILLEGGGTLHWAALESGIAQKVQAYVAPKLFGGREAKTPVEGQGVASPLEAFLLKNSTITRLGEDFLIEGELA